MPGIGEMDSTTDTPETRYLWFSEEAARRVGNICVGLDHNGIPCLYTNMTHTAEAADYQFKDRELVAVTQNEACLVSANGQIQESGRAYCEQNGLPPTVRALISVAKKNTFSLEKKRMTERISKIREKPVQRPRLER